MRFAFPWVLLLIPIVLAAVVFASRRRRPSALFSSLRAPHLRRRTLRTRLMPLVPIARSLCLVCLIIAIARPQRGTGRIETTVEAVAIQIVIDRSGSMDERMFFGGAQRSRLDVVKGVLSEFVLGNDSGLAGRRQDLLGLIAFGTVAETICPPVRDPEAVVELARAIKLPQTRSDAQTAIGDAVALAAARLEKVADELRRRSTGDRTDQVTIKSKLIVLMTDGEQNAGEMELPEAGELARELGVKIYPINIGGQRRDIAVLKEIAERTGGVFLQAGTGDALREVYEEIDRLEKSSVAVIEYTDYDERFVPWVLAAVAALLFEIILTTTWLRRVP